MAQCRHAVPLVPYVIYSGLLATAALAIALIRRYPNRVAAVAAFALFTVVSSFLQYRHSTGRGTPFGDFDKAYYPAGRLAVTAPAELYDCSHSDGLCFVNLPILALLFTPVAMLPLPAAHAVAMVVSVAAIAVATYLLFLIAGASGWQRYAIAALVVLNGPLYYSLRLANLTHVVLALVAFAILCLLSRADGVAGGVLAIGALLKPPLLIWMPYLVLRRRWRGALSMAATLVIVVAASVALFGVGPHAVWLRQFVADTSARPVGAYNVQSINGFLVRLTQSGTLVNWHPVAVDAAFRVAQLVLGTGVVAVAVAAALVGGRPATAAAWLAEFTVVLCAMLLLSPITWTHYYCFLLLPMAAYLTGAIHLPTTRWWAVAVWSSFLLVSLPVALWVPAHPLYGAIIARVLLSHYVFGCTLLLSVLLLSASLHGRSHRSASAGTRELNVGTSSASAR